MDSTRRTLRTRRARSVKAGLEKRLADSLEVALRMGDGVALVDVNGERELLFSEKFACVVCDISYPEIAPRMFSFNNPHGACPTCSGLGTSMYFDPDLIVPDPTHARPVGAVAPWEKKSGGPFKDVVLRAIAQHYRITLDTPYQQLPAKVRQAILQGSAEPLTFLYEKGTRRYEFQRRFEGVIPTLDRRFKETQSEWVREELGDLPINDVVRDDATGDLYASSDFGVVRLPAGATIWTVAAPGMPSVEVAGLTIVPGVRRLYAASHGLGAWLLNLP